LTYIGLLHLASLHECGIEVNVETGVIIDLKNPGLQVLVNQKVKPKDLKWLSFNYLAIA